MAITNTSEIRKNSEDPLVVRWINDHARSSISLPWLLGILFAISATLGLIVAFRSEAVNAFQSLTSNSRQNEQPPLVNFEASTLSGSTASESLSPPSLSSASAPDVSLSINGQNIDIPLSGEVHQTTTDSDGTSTSTTNLDVYIRDGQSSTNNSSSNLRIRVNSESTTKSKLEQSEEVETD